MTYAESNSLVELAELISQALAHRSWQIAAVICGSIVALAVLNVIAPRLELVDHPQGERKRHH
ncbi:MAG TPA: hypothetical protein VMX97_15695, partial [Hyphomicrobiaceae bacterium]|nr:hypothetical protein [Hyphomicrobiaceae bacterium]